MTREQAREKLGLTRAELGDAIGVTEVAIGQWESGRTKNLKLHNALALEDALNIRIRWWAEGKGPMQAAPIMDAYRIALGRRDEARDTRQKRAWERIAAALAKVAMVAKIGPAQGDQTKPKEKPVIYPDQNPVFGGRFGS